MGCGAPPELQQWLRVVSYVTLIFAIPQVICAVATYTYITNPRNGAWWLFVPVVIACILALFSSTR
jgi:hypothetical protein